MKKVPLQVYLDQRDHNLLKRLANRLGLSKAETVREALRRWAIQLAGPEDPLLKLIGGLDSPNVPADLSTRHDEYAARQVRARRVAEPEGGGSRAE